MGMGSDGELGEKLPHPKQDKLGFVRTDQKVVGATPPSNMLEILSNLA